MAKKSVATFRDRSQGANIAKVIRPVRNEKTGAYTFRTEMIPADKVKDYFDGKFEKDQA